jgi:Major Facilitator Superfamily
VLSAATIGLFVFTIIEAPNHGWGSARTLGGFAVAALLATAFVAWERRTEHPILDVDLFRNPRFAAASAAIGISFFALWGFIFLVTQMFQFLKGYGPLSTGVRILPVATSVGVSSILGTKLAVRVGTKLVVAAGLLAMGAFYVWVSTASATTSYLTLAAQMVVCGTGMGLTSAPATEALMGVVPRAKAGVGSAVNEATRLLGGTLGIAVIGSVYASLYASRLTSALPGDLPASVDHAAHESVGAAFATAEQLDLAGQPALASAVHDGASAAFFHGFAAANYVAAGVAAAGALLALAFLPAHPTAHPDETAEPQPLDLPAPAPARA